MSDLFPIFQKTLNPNFELIFCFETRQFFFLFFILSLLKQFIKIRINHRTRHGGLGGVKVQKSSMKYCFKWGSFNASNFVRDGRGFKVRRENNLKEKFYESLFKRRIKEE